MITIQYNFDWNLNSSIRNKIFGMTDRKTEFTGGLEMTLVSSPPEFEVRVLMKRSHENKVQMI